MATLPTFEQLGERPTPQPSLGTASYQTRPANIAGPLTQAGAELDQAAKIVDFTNRRQAAIRAESNANELDQAAQTLKDDPVSGFGIVRGGNAANNEFVPIWMDKLQEKRAAIEQGISDPLQLEMFKKRAEIRTLQFRGQVLSHQAKETDSFNDKTENDTVDITRRDMFENLDNPLAQEAGRATIIATIRNKGMRLGWGEQTIADTTAQYLERINADGAAIMVERQPQSALSLLDKRIGARGAQAENTGNTMIDGLTPAKLVELHGRAVSRVSQIENRNSVEQERIYRDAEKATGEAFDLALTGQKLSAQYASELRAKTAGTQFEAKAEGIIKSADFGAMFGSKSLPQQEEAIRQFDEVAAKDGIGPEQARIRQQLGTINGNQRAAYKANPWTAGTRFADMPPVPEVAISSADQLPALIAQRVPLMSGVEVRSGRAESPLQPNEADSAIDKLSVLPFQQRAAVLGQIGAQLTAPRLEALADQLDKKDQPMALALKLGADRTNAGRYVAEMALGGAQALADKTVQKEDSVLTGWRASIASKIRGTLGDDKAENDAINAAYLVRAYMALPDSNASNYKFRRFLDSGDLETNAVAMVLGQPVERFGIKTVLPKGMSEGDFNSKLRDYTLDRLKEMAPNGIYIRGQPRPLERLASTISTIALKRDGQGRYIPVSSNAMVTTDPAGQNPLRLEIRP